jgi:hypothetical protein
MLAWSIPITVRSPVSPAYQAMQVLEVDEFHVVTVAMLEHTWKTVDHDVHQWITPNLFAFYWLHTIEQVNAWASCHMIK